MKVKIRVEGDDETLLKMMAIQAGMSTEQFAENMVCEGLKFVRASLKEMANGATLNESMSTVLQRKQMEELG